MQKNKLVGNYEIFISLKAKIFQGIKFCGFDDKNDFMRIYFHDCLVTKYNIPLGQDFVVI